MTEPFITFRPPPEFIAYILTFKDEDIHPHHKVPMKGRVVRVYAPGPEQAKEVVRHRFGKAFNMLYDEKSDPRIVSMYPNGMYEQLIWKKV